MNRIKCKRYLPAPTRTSLYSIKRRLDTKRKVDYEVEDLKESIYDLLNPRLEQTKDIRH